MDFDHLRGDIYAYIYGGEPYWSREMYKDGQFVRADQIEEWIRNYMKEACQEIQRLHAINPLVSTDGICTCKWCVPL